MKITVTGRHMTVRESQKEMAARKLSKFDRIFGDLAEAFVTFSAKNEREIIEITIKHGGTFFRSEERSDTFNSAMDEAIESLERVTGVGLTDGNMYIDVQLKQYSVIHGDALSYSIGAASIIAKVYRDHLMEEYAKEYPAYAFEKNKGYGTAAHIQAIKEYGLCPIHRRTFTKNF